MGTAFEIRIYSLSITCPASYPNEPPEVKFNTQINMSGVDPKGNVTSQWSLFAHWKRDYTIERVLECLRKEMVAP